MFITTLTAERKEYVPVEEVYAELKDFFEQHPDLVLPSLDAATDKALKRINRPLRSIRPDSYIGGLVSFRQEFAGEIWLEILILPGYNDDRENLEALKMALASPWH